jgi:hypothetical protein
MKKALQKIVLTIVLITVVFFTATAQTNVSGGIYSNTTWTLANSPYIVTDTVVVFPGITLMIQPGVVVKFDANKQIQLRQSAIIAEGTITDSITFTSNSASPSPGIWSKIYLFGGNMNSRFNYCNIRYAQKGIDYSTNGNLTVNNSNFEFNTIGIYCPNLGVQVATIDNSNFKHCTNKGIDFTYSRATLSVNNCQISNNGTGFSGLYEYGSTISNCIISYNNQGLFAHYMKIDNCIITHNNVGVYSYSVNLIQNCIVDSNLVIGMSCNGDSVKHNQINNNKVGVYAAISTIFENVIEHNGKGVYDNGAWGPSHIIGNSIRYNKIGIDSIHEDFLITKNYIEYDSVGILLMNSNTTILCNKICNNLHRDLVYLSTNNISVINNYWCNADSLTLSGNIYDGYDNFQYGLVTFLPADTSQCYVNPTCASNFQLYPDPVTPHLYYAINMASGVAPISYLWSWGDGTTDTGPYPSHTYSTAGFYTICLTATDGAGNTSIYCDSSYLAKNTNSMVTVNVIPQTITGINDNSTDKSYILFPNPAINTINIGGLENTAKAEVYDISGKLLLTKQLNTNQIDISSLAKGLYFIKLSTAEGSVVRKFVKE